MFPVFRLGIHNIFNKQAGHANAVLIDKDKGIFVTNAHVVNGCGMLTGTKAHIGLPHTKRFKEASISRNWINWDADLAYLRLPEDYSSYPDALFRERGGEPLEKFRILGYRDLDSNEADTVEGRVYNWNSQYGITLPSSESMLAAQAKMRCGKTERHMLYKEYIRFIGTITQGMSGSPLLDQEDRLAGIASASGGGSTLVIPAHEFKCGRAFNKVSAWNPDTKSGIRPWLPGFGAFAVR